MISNEVLSLGAYGFSAFAQDIISSPNSDTSNSISVLGKIAYKGNVASFPNAKYNEDITGFEAKINAPVKYKINGINKNNKNGLININENLSAEDFSSILKSLEVDTSEIEKMEIEISVSKLTSVKSEKTSEMNESNEVVVNESNGIDDIETEELDEIAKHTIVKEIIEVDKGEPKEDTEVDKNESEVNIGTEDSNKELPNEISEKNTIAESEVSSTNPGNELEKVDDTQSVLTEEIKDKNVKQNSKNKEGSDNKTLVTSNKENPILKLGKESISSKDNNVSFPDYVVDFSGKKHLTFETSNKSTYQYKFNNETITYRGTRLSITNITKDEADEILSSLKITMSRTTKIKARLEDVLIKLGEPYDDLVKEYHVVDGDLNTLWYGTESNDKVEVIELEFSEPKYIESVNIFMMSGADVNIGYSPRVVNVSGLKDNEYINIGSKTESVAHKADKTTTVNVNPGVYKKLKIQTKTYFSPVFYEVGINGLDTVALVDTINEVEVYIDKEKSILNLGKEVTSSKDDSVRFPDYVVDFSGNKHLTFETSSESTYEYKLNNETITYKGTRLSITNITKDEADEILSSLKIKISGAIKIKARLEDTLVELGQPYNNQHKDYSVIDGDPSTCWYGTASRNKVEEMVLEFSEPKYIDSVNIRMMSGADVNIGYSPRIVNISGLYDEEYVSIGSKTENIADHVITTTTVDVTPGVYKKIKIQTKTYYSPVFYEVGINESNTLALVDTINEVDVCIDKESPKFEGIRDRRIYIGNKIDLMDDIEVTDNVDTGLSDKVKTSIELMISEDEFKKVDSIDTSKSGSYRVIYSVEDNSENKTEESAIIKVEKEPILKMGNPKVENRVLTFPDATVDFEGELFLYITALNEPKNKPRITFKLDGKEYSYTTNSFRTSRLAKEQVEEIVNSLRIEHKDIVELQFALSEVDIKGAKGYYGEDPYITIDGALEGRWLNNSYTGEVVINFKHPLKLEKFSIHTNAVPASKNNYKIYGKTKNGNWELAGSTTVTVPTGSITLVGINCNGKYYKEIKVYASAASSCIPFFELMPNEEYAIISPTVNKFTIDFNKADNVLPEITGIKDIEIYKNSKINLLEGVSANDDVDKDITDKIKIFNEKNEEIKSLDTSKSGTYLLKYTVYDSSDNITEITRTIKIKEPASILDLSITRIGRLIKGSFTKNSELNYSILRKSDSNPAFEKIDEILASSKNTKNSLVRYFIDSKTYFEDTKIKDVTKPVIEDYYLFRGKEGKNIIELNGEDYGENYTYKVQGIDNINGLAEESKEISKFIPGSGIKGYVYIIDENTNTAVNGNKINSTDGIITLNKVTDNAYIHIKAIDNEGNESDTIHIKLRDLSYNNKPRIYTDKNKVLYVGDTFDPMEGVTAYDYEDGYITKDVRYWGHENVNTSKMGSYSVSYEVLDSKGLASRIETVTIHVAGTIDLKTAGGYDKVNLEWTPEKNASLYRVYRTGPDDKNYTILGEYTDTDTVDLTAIDIKSPVIEKMFEATPKNSTKQELVMEARDLSSTYHYFVQAIDENGDIINSSHVRSGQSKADIDGYAYVIDKKSDTQAPTKINAKTITEVINAVKGNDKKILHIRAIDKNGNLGDTVHHLIGGKYETNFTPVISGVKNKAVLVGSKLNLSENVTASDYEDGNLTKKIKISTNLDLNNVGKYEVKYTVTDKDNNTREITSYVRVVKYMDLTATPDLKNNNIILDWEKEKITNIPVYYEVRKYNPEIDRYAVIGRTNDTKFVDVDCKDIFGPKYYGSDKTILDNGELSVDINMKDRGPNNRYQVVARMRLDNTVVGTMTDLEDSDNEMYTVGSFAGGIEGYSWHLSNIREDVVDKTIDEYSNNITTGFKGFTWLHFAAIDVYGNKTDTVHIKLGNTLTLLNNKPPVLEVEDTEILIGTNFNPLSIAKAYDEEDGDLTKYITVSGTVDTSTLGQYPLVYSVTDFSGNQTSKKIIVTVVDRKKVAPAVSNRGDYIEVQSADEVTIIVGTPYNPMENVKVKSTKDGDITEKVTYTTNLNINVIGDYIINYFVQDSLGNSISFKRIVHVVPKGTKVPSITSTGNKVNVPWFEIYSYIHVGIGADINPRDGVRAYDEEDGELTSEIKVYGVVNTLIPGWHTIYYRVTDSDGNTSYATRGVLVEEYEHVNPEGDKPIKDDDNDIDKGENGGGLPNKPSQPNQPGVEGEKPGKPTGGKPEYENDKHDIYEELDIKEEVPSNTTDTNNKLEDTSKDKSNDDPQNIDKNIDDNIDIDSNVNVDTNSDGIPDINIDTDGDNKADVNIDIDNDRLPDINIDIDGDGSPDINIDTDGDNKADEKIEPNYKDKINVSSDTNWMSNQSSKKWGIKSHAPKGTSLLDKILYYPMEFNLNGKVVYDIPKARKVSLKKVLTKKENSKSNYNYIYTSDKTKSNETLKEITFKGNNFYLKTQNKTIEFNVKEDYILEDIKEQVEQLSARGIDKFTVEEVKEIIKVNRNKKHVPLDIETVHIVENPYINTIISPNLNDGLIIENITISNSYKNMGIIKPNENRKTTNTITVDTAEIKLGKYKVKSTVSLGNRKVFESERTIAILSIRMILLILLLIGLAILTISYISSKRREEKENKESDENTESIEL